MSILQLACLMGHQTLTNILIERGADINVKDIVVSYVIKFRDTDYIKDITLTI